MRSTKKAYLSAFALSCFVLLAFSGAASATSGGVTFGAIQNLSINPGASTAPVVATTSDGTHQYVYVAWEDTSNGGSKTFFQRSTDGGTMWGFVIVFTGISGKANARTSAVQIAAEGQYVFLTWEQGSQTAFASSSDYGATFSCGASSTIACVLSAGVPAGVMTAQAVAASGSNVYVGWADSASDGSQYIFLAASTNAGATFSTPVQLNTGAAEFTHGETELAASGNYVYATWDLVWFSVSADNGQTWSTPTQMIPSSCFFPCIGREPMISASGSYVYLTFPMGGYHGAGSYSAIVNVSPDNGNTWTQINLSGAYLSNIREVQVTSYGDNVYVTSRGTNTGVKGVQQYVYVSNDDGKDWAGPTILGVLSGAENGFGGLAVDQSTGAVYVQWPHGNTGQVYLSASQDDGATWSAVQQVSASTGGVVSMGDPSGGQGPMAAAGNGYLFVVWEDLSTGNGDIYFAAVAPS